MNSHQKKLKQIKNAFSKNNLLSGKLESAFKLIDSELAHELFNEKSNLQASGSSLENLIGQISSPQKGYLIYTDGACRGNPGPGAWAWVCFNHKGFVADDSDNSKLSTNNKMELQAVIEALSFLQEKDRSSLNSLVEIYSDSKYVVTGIKEWVPNWKRRGWRKADKSQPENLELWQQLDQLYYQDFTSLKIHWVKGHSGHPGNEYCDQLANQELDNNGY